jgi:hypothetical protein
MSCSSSSGASMIMSTRVPPSSTSFSHAVKSGTWKITTRSAARTASSVPLQRPTVGTPTLVHEGSEFTHIS